MKSEAKTTKENQPHSSTSLQPTKVLKANEGGDIVDLILKDHIPLKDLIEILKDDEAKREQKEGPLEEFAVLLTAHAKSEEKSLYVEMKEHKGLRIEGFEGDTEHAIADQLVQEINATPDDDEWTAKVKVLAELVEHHIEEEEEEMLPEVEKSLPPAIRQKVGAKYTEFKQEYDTLLMSSPKPAKKKDFIEH